jgi:hypothetical protein
MSRTTALSKKAISIAPHEDTRRLQIHVDAGQPATLNDGAGKPTDCPTLQEAVLAWHALPAEQKIRATVKVIGGPVYTAHHIHRLHYGAKPNREDCDVEGSKKQ